MMFPCHRQCSSHISHCGHPTSHVLPFLLKESCTPQSHYFLVLRSTSEMLKLKLIWFTALIFSHYICLTNVTGNPEPTVMFFFFVCFSPPNVIKTSFITTLHCKFPFQRFGIKMRLWAVRYLSILFILCMSATHPVLERVQKSLWFFWNLNNMASDDNTHMTYTSHSTFVLNIQVAFFFFFWRWKQGWGSSRILTWLLVNVLQKCET